MSWDDTTSPPALKLALAEGRHDEAESLLAGLVEDMETTNRCVPAGVAAGLLAALRSHLAFEQIERVAAALDACGQDDPEVRRQLAQARLEVPGGITRAIAGLLPLEQEIEQRLAADDLDTLAKRRLTFERGEVVGLLGRAYKQLYVDAVPNQAEPRTHDWEQSLAWYRKGYEAQWGDYLWHGINVVALVTHAERIQSGKRNAYPARKQAEAIVAALDASERAAPLGPWTLATRAEALLACGRTPDAIAAFRAYLDSPGLTAFNIYSTRRQLEQLYVLDADSPPGATILPMMTARMAELGVHDRRVPPVDVSPKQGKRLERVLGDVSYKPLAWLKAGVERAQCVARLGETPFEGMGTGFLFDGALIAERHAGRHLLLTNAHVCSPDEKVRRRCPWPAAPTALKATFLAARGEGEPVSIAVQDVLFSSAPDALDATLVELAGPPPEGAVAPPRADGPPAVDGDDARVNVIGHPKGLDVRVSMQDNKVVAREDPFLRYRTPTDPGSSGSPVFNQDWELVALHHAGDKGANEGILLDALLDAMRKAMA